MGAVAGAGWGAIAGVVYAGLKCGVGINSCITGGNDFTNAFGCAAAAIDIAIKNYSGGVKGAAGCAKWILCGEKPVVQACDPNEIVGPPGFGPERFVPRDEEMDFIIYFENDPDFATTAAQRVTVIQPLHPNFNPLSFRLGEFGFGPYVFQIPANVSNYTVTLPTQDSADIGVDLQFTAGVDVINRELFWVLQSVDRATGLPPSDPFAGFLKVNDSTGVGEGFVKYIIRPQMATVTGDSVTAYADIIFDINSIITTNTEFNTIDAFPPSSLMAPLLPTQDSTSFEISWNGQDDSGGSGIAAYVVYAAENGGPYLPVANLSGIDTTFMFTGKNLHQYDFFVQARDNVGNEEPFKNIAETSTFINTNEIRILGPDGSQVYCEGDTVFISWIAEDINPINITWSADSGTTYQIIATRLDSTQSPFAWIVPANIPNGFYLFRVSDTTNTAISISNYIQLGRLPVIVMQADTAICLGDSISLHVSGGLHYRWSPAVGLSDTTSNSPWASPQTTTTYSMKVTTDIGCEKIASVTITVVPQDTVYAFTNTCDSAMAGVFSLIVPNAFGCDSTHINMVTFRPSFQTLVASHDICDGDSVLVFGQWAKLAGVYEDTLQTIYGCDSVLLVDVQVRPLASSMPIVVICDGDSAFAGNQWQTLAGTYVDVFPAANGCDSTVTTTLNVLPNATGTQTLTICDGDSAFAGGTWRTTAGVYTDVLPAANGCDSTVTTMLQVFPNATGTQTLTICDGDSAFAGGNWQMTSGNYV
ncbi:MAG: fibronectin type III domain-containing protein, partial [Oceanicaulis sp.]|nr:fibronectin type III domain-containing protein [Oceanicaulis sp.]